MYHSSFISFTPTIIFLFHIFQWSLLPVCQFIFPFLPHFSIYIFHSLFLFLSFLLSLQFSFVSSIFLSPLFVSLCPLSPLFFLSFSFFYSLHLPFPHFSMVSSALFSIHFPFTSPSFLFSSFHSISLLCFLHPPIPLFDYLFSIFLLYFSFLISFTFYFHFSFFPTLHFHTLLFNVCPSLFAGLPGLQCGVGPQLSTLVFFPAFFINSSSSSGPQKPSV